MQHKENIVIPNVSALPSEATAEKEILQSQSILSLLVVPINSKEGELLGFMGYDDTEDYRTWSDKDIRILRVASEMISNYLKRKQAEEALRIKDNAIESSINGIGIADLKGYLTYVNNSFLKMWGYDEKEALGAHVNIFWQKEEDATEVIEALHRMGGWIGELKAKRKDGSLFDVELSASLVKDETGRAQPFFSSLVFFDQIHCMHLAISISCVDFDTCHVINNIRQNKNMCF